MTQAKPPMLRHAGALLVAFALPASAQGWETFSHDLGYGAAVCPQDDPDTGAFFCFAVACLPEGGTPLIRVAFAGPETPPKSTPLSIRVDGTMVSHLFLTRLSSEGMFDFGIPLDPARDAALIAALKSGSRATLIFGIGLAATIQPISLRGSHAALDEVPLLCGSAPFPEPAGE